MRTVVASLALAGCSSDSSGPGSAMDASPHGDTSASRCASAGAVPQAVNEPLPPANPEQPEFCVDCLSFRVQAPQVAYYKPDGCFGGAEKQLDDGAVVIVPYEGKLRGYISSQNSRYFESDNIDTLFCSQADDQIVLRRSGTINDNTCGGSDDPPGAPNALDSSGRWICGAEPDPVDPGLMRVWYHGETQSNYCREHSHWTIAYGQTRDGKEFELPNWPENAVIRTQWPPLPAQDCVADPSRCAVRGVGNPSVMPFGDHYFIYAMDSGNLSIQRSAIADGGVPGSWQRYANGAFSEDGIGGVSSAVFDVNGNWVDLAIRAPSVFGPSQQVMLVGNDKQSKGFKALFSPDGFSGWQPVKEPLFLSDRIWDTSRNRELIEYPSVYSREGTHAWNQSFEIFYAMRPPEPSPGGCGPRYLIHRSVHVVASPTPVVGHQVKVALSRFYDDTAGNHVATTQGLPPSYRFDQNVGFLATVQSVPEMDQLLECWSESAQARRVAVYTCGDTDRFMRRLGFVYRTPRPGTHALVQCVGKQANGRSDFVVEAGTSCGSRAVDRVLGYAFD